MPLIDVVHKQHSCVDYGLLPSFGSLHDVFGIIKTSPWSGNIQLILAQGPLSSMFEVYRLRLVTLDPATKACSIFSNRLLLYCYGG